MDFVTDQNPLPVYLADRLVQTPDYVKQANVIEAEQLSRLSDAAFADPVRREHPIFDKAATWLSAAYVFGSEDPNEEIVARIKTAADMFGILPEILDLETAIFTQTKEASVETIDPHYALTVEFNGAHGLDKKGFYPLDNPVQIEASARAMYRDAVDGRLPIDFFRDAAEELVKAAKAQSMEMNELIAPVVALGTRRLPNFEHARTVANLRKSAGVTDEALELYKEAVDGAAAEPHNVDQWINIWVELDTTFGVKYASFDDPYSAFYAGVSEEEVDKAAAELVVVGEVLVPRAAFANLAEADAEKHFSKAASAHVLSAIRSCDAHKTAEACSAVSQLSDSERQTLLNVLLLRNA